MRRATFAVIGALAFGALVAPSVAVAQPPAKVHRLAIVSPSGPVTDMTEAAGDPSWGVFFAELRRLGYTEKQNLVVKRWSGGGRRESYPELAREVVRWGPHVVFTISGRMAQAFLAVTRSVPIVTMTTDPVALGLAASLARPGGNVTGFSLDAGNEVLGKRLELLKAAVPGGSRVAFLAPRVVLEGPWGRIVREAGTHTGLTILDAPLGTPLDEPEYRRAFAALGAGRPDGLLVSDHAEGIARRQLIVELAMQARLPAIYPHRPYVEVGGLMAYAADQTERPRQVAGYIDRILRGASPGELPFQQPTRFELIVNLRTARALRLTLPPALLLRADHVIQ